MKHSIRLAVAAALLAAAGAASAGVNVKYVAPEDFADVPYSDVERDRLLRELSDHFGKLAKQLPPGQDLNVEVLDIDLAGQLKPMRWAVQDIRVMTGGADWPHITLRYTITQDGQVIKSGQERVQNMNYTHRMNRYFASETLRYEKQMLDDWFKQTVAAR